MTESNLPPADRQLFDAMRALTDQMITGGIGGREVYLAMMSFSALGLSKTIGREGAARVMHHTAESLTDPRQVTIQ